MHVKFCLQQFIPKVVIEWLILLLRIREIPGSNLGQGTSYHD
jgi:hypothetical protein